jgi:hypothetical protein
MVFKQCKLYTEATITTNTAPIDIITTGAQWRPALLKWFPKLRAGGWFVIEEFEASSADAVDMFHAVLAMHRMYMAKDHTDFTVFGKEVDHEFKSMFFWKGSVWLEKGVG